VCDLRIAIGTRYRIARSLRRRARDERDRYEKWNAGGHIHKRLQKTPRQKKFRRKKTEIVH